MDQTRSAPSWHSVPTGSIPPLKQGVSEIKSGYFPYVPALKVLGPFKNQSHGVALLVTMAS